MACCRLTAIIDLCDNTSISEWLHPLKEAVSSATWAKWIRTTSRTFWGYILWCISGPDHISPVRVGKDAAAKAIIFWIYEVGLGLVFAESPKSLRLHSFCADPLNWARSTEVLLILSTIWNIAVINCKYGLHVFLMCSQLGSSPLLTFLWWFLSFNISSLMN